MDKHFPADNVLIGENLGSEVRWVPGKEALLNTRQVSPDLSAAGNGWK